MKQFFLILAILGFSISFAQKLEYTNGKFYQDGEQYRDVTPRRCRLSLSHDVKARVRASPFSEFRLDARLSLRVYSPQSGESPHKVFRVECSLG